MNGTLLSGGEVQNFLGPRELIGRSRSDVRLIHGNLENGDISLYSTFDSILNLLRPGDMIIFNDSLTLPSSLDGYIKGDKYFGRIHVGQQVRRGVYLVEVRPKELNKILPEGETFVHSNSGLEFELTKRHEDFPRYFEARISRENININNFLIQYGSPIYYEGYTVPYEKKYYRNVFQDVYGSSEYPSASRPFTNEIITKLVGRGVTIGKLTLHCNLGSLESDEYSGKGKLLREYYKIPDDLPEKILRTKKNGGRIIGVGTTVVRALVSSVKNEVMLDLEGISDIKISADSKIWPLDGIISGIHDPESSHLELLEAFGGKQILSPISSLSNEFHLIGHEFGDSMLLL